MEEEAIVRKNVEIVQKMCEEILEISDILSEKDCKNTLVLGEVAKEYSVTRTQLILLKKIAQEENNDDLTVNELAIKVNRSSAAIVPHLNQLEDRGFIRRVRDKYDRRKVIVKITPLGKALIEQLNKRVVVPPYVPRLAKMETEELEKLLKEVQKLHDLILNACGIT